jgi:hypothetical protein
MVSRPPDKTASRQGSEFLPRDLQALTSAGSPPAISPRSLDNPGHILTRGFCIRGGRAEVRQALYMPALVAARFNPDMRAKYKQLACAGKPVKVALTAVMRKLIVLANALLKANRSWTPKYA